MTDKPYNKPIPNVNDPANGPFWAAAKQRKLTAHQCTSCKSYRFPALEICPTCLEQGAEWTEVSPEGTIWSFATYHRAFHPGFKEDLPYVVAMVDNKEGVSYVGLMTGSLEGLAVGAKVRTVFEDMTDEFTLPKWELVRD